MPVVAAELIAYSSGLWTAYPDDSATVSSTTYANIGTAISTPTPGGVIGGAIDLATRVILTQIAATDTVNIISDGADVRTVTIVGRLATGVLTSEIMTLNGAVGVGPSVNSYERIESVTLSAVSAVRTFTLRRTTGLVTIATFGGPAPADATEIRATAMFRNATTPASGNTIRYEKFFWKNANAAAFALTSASFTGTDPLNHIRHGVAAAVNDSLVVANRITAPAAIAFVNDTIVNVPGGGNLAAGSQIGVWLEQNLAVEAAFKDTFTSTLIGNTI